MKIPLALLMILLSNIPSGNCVCVPGSNELECQQKGLNSQCTSTVECQTTLTCLKSVCGCETSTEYIDGNQCKFRKTFENKCASTKECWYSLACIGGKCTCTETAYQSGNRCEAKKTLDDSCSNSIQCLGTLSCLGSNCACADANDYWDQSTRLCQQRKNRLSFCKNVKNECRTPFVCVNSKCDCEENKYFLENNKVFYCLSKKDAGQQCSTSNQCKDPLVCSSNQCKCQGDTYYAGGKCLARKKKDGICSPSSFDNECKSTLTCINGKCDCQSSQYYSGSGCVSKKGYNVACDSPDQCRDPYTCVNRRCQCDSVTYYISGRCEQKKDKGEVCSSSNECKNNLTCISRRCGCPSSTYYYSQGHCFTRKAKDNPCSIPPIPNECVNALTCINGKCDCQSAQYYSGSTCHTKKNYNVVCYAPAQCKHPYTCGSNRRCICSSDTYYSGGLCKPKKSLNEHCTSTSQCIDRAAICTTPRAFTNKPTCLCKTGYYHNTISGNCSLVSDFQVRSCLVSNHTDDSISFTWRADTHGKIVSYQITNSAVGSFQTASETGGKVFNLPSGSKYYFSIVSTLAQDNNYRTTSTTYKYGYAWTKPSKPGYFDASKSQLLKNPMKFGFFPSQGTVYEYKVTITQGEGSRVYVTKGLHITLTLESGKTYGYEIAAFNGNQDRSDRVSTDTFTTDPEVPPPVRDFKVVAIKATNVVVEWKSPIDPKGDIHAFVIQVYMGNTCRTGYFFKCSDCPNNKLLPSLTGCEKTVESTVKSKDVKDPNHLFTTKMTLLTAYTKYNVKAFAVTEAGNGNPAQVSFTTDEGAPEKIVALDLSSRRVSTRVNLLIVWTPGKEMGQTTYEVQVNHTEAGTQVYFYNKPGYKTNTLSVNSVLAYHNYTVSVVVKTKYGRSEPVTKIIQTTTTNPGAVSNLAVLQDPDWATRMVLQFKCPPENHWNGELQGFAILKNSGKSILYQVEAKAEDCKDFIRVSSTELGDFVVNIRYLLQVSAKNQDYESTLKRGVYFQPRAKVPIFQRPVLSQSSKSVITNTSVTVSLCTSCITDPIQGVITNAALIVCVVSENISCTAGAPSRTKRATLTEATLKNYQSWAQASGSGFQAPYRVTPNDWLATLKKENLSSYTIGKDNSCTNDANSFCNGPLPPMSDITVTAIACTSAGCQDAPPLLIRRSGGDDEGDSGLGVGAFVGIAIAAVVVLIILAVIVFWCTRKERKISSNRPPSLSELRKSDDHNKKAHCNEMQNLSQNESRPIKIRDFCKHVEDMHKNSNELFVEQYKDLQNLSSKIKIPASSSSGYDIHTGRRVSLSVSSHIDGTFIPGHDSKEDYIATQGPVKSTAKHFWAMVWDEKTKVIVMLSDPKENRTENTDLYLPRSSNRADTFGDFSVKTISSTIVKKCIVQELMLSLDKSSRMVIHLTIPGWWRKGSETPPGDLLDFVRTARGRMTDGASSPLIVQCSGGVGRTGTFIALDYLMQHVKQLSSEDDIDVFNYVLQMRKCRRYMVTDESQYILIFDALSEMIKTLAEVEKEAPYDRVGYEINGNDYDRLMMNRKSNVVQNPHYMNCVEENDYETLT